MSRLLGLMSYSLKHHLFLYTVYNTAFVKVMQPKQTATRDLTQFILIQTVPLMNEFTE